jgi:iron(III) transport system ATP-binding protein
MSSVPQQVAAGAGDAPGPEVAIRTTGEGQGSPAPVVRVRNLVKRFRRADGTVAVALDDVSFDVGPGEMVVLLGPRGCGKATVLRSIAGCDSPDAGVVEIHGDACFDGSVGVDVAPGRRRLGVVLPNYGLWPHLTVLQNVAGPSRVARRRGLGGGEAAERARAALDRVGIAALAEEHPHRLSAGSRQRVALARALVAGPDLVLFAGPMAGVGGRPRAQLRLELLALQRELGFAAVFATHDRHEALELGHRVAVMDHGRIVQLGGPRHVYDEPASRYVATYVGTANQLVGRVVAIGDAVRVATPLGEVTGRSGPVSLATGDHVVALWRPERTRLGRHEPVGPNRWPVTVEGSIHLGAHIQQAASAAGHRFLVWQDGSAPERPGAGDAGMAGDRGWVGVDPTHVRVLPADASR